MTTPASGSNKTDPAPGALRKGTPAGAGLRGVGLLRCCCLFRRPELSLLGDCALSFETATARKPVPSETEVARAHRRSQRAAPVQRCLRAGKRPAATLWNRIGFFLEHSHSADLQVVCQFRRGAEALKSRVVRGDLNPVSQLLRFPRLSVTCLSNSSVSKYWQCSHYQIP